MSFVFITTALILVTLVLDSVVSAPAPFEVRQRQLHNAGIGIGIGMEPETEVASKVPSSSVEESSSRQPRAIGSWSSTSGCFLTGCVPYSFTTKSHGCGEGSLYKGQTKCEDGFIYECCPSPVRVRPPMALFIPDDKDSSDSDNDNAKPGNGKWSVVNMKRTAHKILCMLGNVHEVFC